MKQADCNRNQSAPAFLYGHEPFGEGILPCGTLRCTEIAGQEKRPLAEIETLLNPHEIKENQTSAEVQHRLKSRDKIGQEYGLSRDKVAKYIRLAGLVSDLMERVDTGEIAFLAAYDLSFVEDTAKQQQIADLMESDSYKVDMKKAGLLRSYYETSKLTDTAIVQILPARKQGNPRATSPSLLKLNQR